MPLYWPLLFHKDRLANYEVHQISAFSKALDKLGENITFVDCGADVGLFTRLVLQRSKSIALLHAFEPNPKSFSILDRNLSRVGPECHLHCAAVSDHEGAATLAIPAQEQGGIYRDHASHIVAIDDGSVLVTTIDYLGLPHDRPLAIKIDVEGEELNVLKGAKATLGTVPNFVVQVEAHIDVANRTKIDPVEFVKFVGEIRDVSMMIVHDTGGVMGDHLSMERPFFEQYPVKSCDIIMMSKPH